MKRLLFTFLLLLGLSAQAANPSFNDIQLSKGRYYWPWTRDASEFGFSASASGAANVAAISNAFMVATNVTINLAGNYPLASTVFLPSGCSLIGSKGVTLYKSQSYCNMIANQNAGNGGTNWDSNITIANLNLSENNYDVTNGGFYQGRGRALVTFMFVTNLTVNGLSSLDGTNETVQYFFEGLEVNHAKINDVNFYGGKDCLHFGSGCRNVVVDGFSIASGDDPLSLRLMVKLGRWEHLPDRGRCGEHK